MRANRWALTALSLILVACGGGGGSEGPKDNPFGFSSIGVTSIETRALALSPDGKSIVGTDSGIAGTKPVGWLLGKAAIRLNVLAPGDNFSVATGISADGSTVVGYGTVPPSGLSGVLPSGDPTAIQWNEDSGAQQLPNLPGGLWSYATSISEDGTLITGAAIVPDVNAVTGWSSRAVTWTNGVIEDMGLPAGQQGAAAIEVSGDGSVVTGVFSAGSGFFWTKSGGYVSLPAIPGGANFLPAGISRNGGIIVGTSGGQAARWSGGQSAGLGLLLGWSASSATAVSANGNRIVGYASNGSLNESSAEAFIWDNLHGIRSLAEVMHQTGMPNAFDGWTSSIATGISADGQTIVGYGMSPRGKIESWSVRLP